VLDTPVARLVLSIAAAALFYGALFTGRAPAPAGPVAAAAPRGLQTDAAKGLTTEARAHIASGEYAQALGPLLALHEADPASHVVVEQLAQTYHHLNRPVDEARLWEEYLLKAPHPDQACPHLGLAYRAQGREDKALDAFERCLAFDPSNPDAILYLALAHERAGRLDEAAALYTRGLTLSPSYADLQLGLARIGLRRGKAGEAKAAALRVLEKSPRNTDALLVAGLACLRSGENAEARTYLERGLALSPGNPELAQALAQAKARGEGRR
jgi:tetratricopeptide (TPR) repeat protein